MRLRYCVGINPLFSVMIVIVISDYEWYGISKSVRLNPDTIYLPLRLSLWTDRLDLGYSQA